MDHQVRLQISFQNEAFCTAFVVTEKTPDARVCFHMYIQRAGSYKPLTTTFYGTDKRPFSPMGSQVQLPIHLVG